MIRIGLSFVTMAFVSALWVVHGLKSVENIDFNLPDRAIREVSAKNNLFISSIYSSGQPNRFAYLHEKNMRIARHAQDLLELQETVNGKAFVN